MTGRRMRVPEVVVLGAVVMVVLGAAVHIDGAVVFDGPTPTRDGVLIPLEDNNVEIASAKAGWMRLSVFPPWAVQGGHVPTPMVDQRPGDVQPFEWWRDKDLLILSTEAGRLVLAENGTTWALQRRDDHTVMLSHELLTRSKQQPQDVLLHVARSAGAKGYGCGRLTNETGPGALACERGLPLVSEFGFLSSFVWSTDGFAMLGVVPDDEDCTQPFLNVSWAQANAEYLWQFQQSRLDLYLAPAATLREAIALFWNLTGAPGLLPGYALSFLASRSGWDRPPSIAKAVDEFHSADFPIAGVVSDYEWFTRESDAKLPPQGSANFSDFGLNPVVLPGGRKFLQKLRDEGLRFGGMRWPRLGNKDNLQEARRRGCLFPDRVAPRQLRLHHKNCRDWYSAKLRADTKDGVSFFWNTGGDSAYYTYMYWTRAQINAFQDHISPTTTTTTTSTTTSTTSSSTTTTSTTTTSTTTTSTTSTTTTSTRKTTTTTTTTKTKATTTTATATTTTTPTTKTAAATTIATNMTSTNGTTASAHPTATTTIKAPSTAAGRLQRRRRKHSVMARALTMREQHAETDPAAESTTTTTAAAAAAVIMDGVVGGAVGQRHRSRQVDHALTAKVLGDVGELDTAMRPFSLNNAFVPGMQALGAVPTTGRVDSAWDDLRAAAADVVAFAVAGTAFVSVDIGGNSPGSLPDALLVRWYQLGMFTTVPRANSARTSGPHFPFDVGSPEAEDAIRSAMKLRQSLLPTVYAAMMRQRASLVPMLRPLLLDFPDDARAAETTTQWLLGSALMVAPVLSSKGEVEVYFPPAVWFPFHRVPGKGKTACISGPATHRVQAGLAETPLYVLAGSLLALQSVQQEPEPRPGLLSVYVYAGGNATLEVVEDDGETYGAPRRITTFHWDDARLILSWKRTGVSASGAPSDPDSHWLRFPATSPGFVVVQAVLWQNSSVPVQSHARNIGTSGFLDFAALLHRQR